MTTSRYEGHSTGKPATWQVRRVSFLIALGAMVGLAALFFTIWSLLSSRGEPNGVNVALPMLAVTFVFAVTALLKVVFSPRASIADTIVVYFVAVSYSFVGLYQETWRHFAWPVVHTRADGSWAAALTTLFLAMYLVGASVHRGRRGPDRWTIVGNRRALRAALGILAVSYAIIIALGPSNVIRPRHGEMESLATSTTQLLFVAKSFSLTGFLYFQLAYMKSEGRQRRANMKRLLVASVPVLVFFNPITNARFHFVAAVFSTATIGLAWWRIGSASKALTFLALTAANFVLLGPLKSLSGGLSKLDTSFYDNVGASLREYAYRVDFDSYQVSANAVEYFRNNDFFHGSNIASAILFFIPRSLWDGKAEGSNYIVHRELGYVYQNLSFPLPFEFYAAGGVPAVAIASFYFGRWMRHLADRSCENEKSCSFGASNIMLALLAGYMPILLRGALNAVVPQFGFSFVGVFIIVLASRFTFRVSANER